MANYFSRRKIVSWQSVPSEQSQKQTRAFEQKIQHAEQSQPEIELQLQSQVKSQTK